MSPKEIPSTFNQGIDLVTSGLNAPPADLEKIERDERLQLIVEIFVERFNASKRDVELLDIGDHENYKDYTFVRVADKVFAVRRFRIYRGEKIQYDRRTQQKHEPIRTVYKAFLVSIVNDQSRTLAARAFVPLGFMTRQGVELMAEEAPLQFNPTVVIKRLQMGARLKETIGKE